MHTVLWCMTCGLRKTLDLCNGPCHCMPETPLHARGYKFIWIYELFQLVLFPSCYSEDLLVVILRIY